jgi:hypothetical protein
MMRAIPVKSQQILDQKRAESAFYPANYSGRSDKGILSELTLPQYDYVGA